MENETVEVVQEKKNGMAQVRRPSLNVGEKICPKCHKSFKPAGLAGHLRFVHGLKPEKASEASKGAKVDKATSLDGIFLLIEKIEKVRERKASLEEKYSSFFGTPEAIQDALEVLGEQEEKLRDELRRLKGGKKQKGSSFWDYDPLADFFNEKDNEEDKEVSQKKK